MSNIDTFYRFRGLLTQAVIAYNADEPISWDVKSSGMSAAYIRATLRTVMKNYIVTSKWHEPDIPPSIIQNILANWALRDTPTGHVELGPRRPPFRSTLPELDPNYIAPATETSISIDGTNPAFVNAIALLKNYDQIPQSILLTDFDTSLLDTLYSTYPNIELIQDTIAGVQTPNYILI